MITRRLALTLALLMVGLPALADQAKERGSSGGGGSHSGGGGGGGSHSGGGAESRHPGVSSSSSGSSSSSHSGTTSSGPPPTGAEGRHPRPGTGHGHRYGYAYPGYYPYYGSYPYYGYYPYGYYPYGYYGYFGYGYPYYAYPFSFGFSYGSYGNDQSSYRESSSLRLLVDPSETRVYVDGYYAGVVDDFDGMFQRLHVSPGRHEIALKLDGYRTHRIRLYAPPDHTIKIHHDMVKGTGEDAEEMPGAPPVDEERRPPATDEGYRGDPQAPSGDQGMLRLNVRPEDASVYVDGEFRGTARQVRALPLPPGRHRVEVVWPGFRTFDHDVDVRPGRPADVEVEMERPY